MFTEIQTRKPAHSNKSTFSYITSEIITLHNFELKLYIFLRTAFVDTELVAIPGILFQLSNFDVLFEF